MKKKAPVEFAVSAEEKHPACKLNLSALGARERRARAAEPNRRACGNQERGKRTEIRPVVTIQTRHIEEEEPDVAPSGTVLLH